MGEEMMFTKFVTEPTSHLMCPHCNDVYKEPVINVKCGHTFCKACARSNNLRSCPADKIEIDTTQLVPNRIVLNQVEDLQIFCRYGFVFRDDVWELDSDGCRETIALGARDSHESSCRFKPISCPNSPAQCGDCYSGDLNAHLAVCPFTPCAHKQTDCDFVGSPEDVSQHQRICTHAVKHQQDIQLQVQTVECQNKDLSKQVSSLTKRVQGLESENRSLSTDLKNCLSSLQTLQSKYEGLELTVNKLERRARSSSLSPPGSSEHKPRPISQISKKTSRGLSTSSLNDLSSSVKSESWRMPFTFKCIGTYRGHQNVVFSICAHKGKLYSSGADCMIKVWDLDNLIKGCVRTIEGHNKPVHCLTTGLGCLYSAGEDYTIRLWALDTGEELRCVKNAHENLICAMAINAEYLFTSSHSLIKVWEAKSLNHIHSISGLCHWVRALALNQSKDLLYSGSHNTIDIWDATWKFQSEGKITQDFGSVYSLAITSQYIIAGTYNRNVYVFDINSHDAVQHLKCHIGIVTTLVVSPSGKFCFTGSSDNTVMVWNLENMLPIQTLQRHDGPVHTLSMYGDLVLSGSEDREIKVYKYFQMQIGFGL